MDVDLQEEMEVEIGEEVSLRVRFPYQLIILSDGGGGRGGGGRGGESAGERIAEGVLGTLLG